MQPFSIGDIYYDDNNMRIVDINPIGKNCCTFDCVFCPIGKTDIKTDKAIDFKGTQEFLERLKNFLNNNSVDMVFINPSGEAILNNKIKEIITYIKEKKIKVRIITNGYIFNMSEYINIYNYCDEVIAEIAVMENKYFKKLQRPLEEFTLNEYIKNLKIFRQQYKGRFILDIIILKNYSNDYDSIEKFKKLIKEMEPDEILVETPTEKRLKNRFNVQERILNSINKYFNSFIK